MCAAPESPLRACFLHYCTLREGEREEQVGRREKVGEKEKAVEENKDAMLYAHVSRSTQV